MEDFFEEKNNNESLDLRRYLRVILKKWWLVGLVTLVVTVPWILYLKKQPPVYEAEAWISFENVGGELPENLIQQRSLKLKSRSFVEEVTAELGLTVQLIQEEDKPELLRNDVFNKIATASTAVTGIYSILYYPIGTCAIYRGMSRVDSLFVKNLTEDTVTYNGISFALKEGLFRNRNSVAFEVKDFRGTVKSLRDRVRVNFSRTGDLMSISLRDNDPHLVSQTVNLLGEIFIYKSIEIERNQSRLISNYLKDQLDIVQSELNKSDDQLKRFRDTYLVGLDETTRRSLNSMEAMQTTMASLTMQKQELEMLLNRLNPLSDDVDLGKAERYVYRELARRPIFAGSADMTVARQQMDDMDQIRAGLLNNYPETNPRVVELSEQINVIEEKISRLANEKVRALDSQIHEMTISIDSLEKRLSTLPAEALRQLKMERERRANEEIYQEILRRYKDAQISEAVTVENVSWVDRAIPPDRPLSADKKKKAILGAFIGMFLGVGIVLLLEAADRSIKTRDDVKRHLKIPLLGIIPMVKFDEYELKDSEKAKSISSQIVTHDYSPTPVGEAYRSLRTNLLFSKGVGPLHTLAIGSVSPGEGKSFTAANLAITLAQQKSNTLLIDADLRRGVLHNTFNCPKKPGLTNYLTGVAALEDVLHETYIPNLTLITCGSMIPNPSELLGSVRMKRFIEGISKRYDFVIFDTPPLIATSDAIILGTLVDGIAVLIRAGKTNRDDLQRKLEMFQNVQAKVAGAILNCAGVEIAHEGYSYYRY